MKSSQTITLDLLNTQLVEHKRNMRRLYKLDDVRRMALSQAKRVARGQPACIQPLIVTPGAGETTYNSAKHHKLITIAGHLRLRGNRYLGAKAPKLNCVLRFYANEADMLADMSTENGIRADPGPVSWGLHFRDLLDNEGANLRDLARDSGKSVQTIRELLALLDLAEPVQTLIDNGQLQITAADQLRRIKSAALQAKAAKRFVRSDTPVHQMKLVVDHLLDPAGKSAYQNSTSFKKKIPTQAEEASRLTRWDDAPAAPALEGQPAELDATLEDLRAAARFTCIKCPISTEHGQPEAAWHLATAAAGAVCSGCNMRLIKEACNSCPLPQMLSRVVRQRRQAQARPAVMNVLQGLAA